MHLPSPARYCFHSLSPSPACHLTHPPSHPLAICFQAIRLKSILLMLSGQLLASLSSRFSHSMTSLYKLPSSLLSPYQPDVVASFANQPDRCTSAHFLIRSAVMILIQLPSPTRLRRAIPMLLKHGKLKKTSQGQVRPFDLPLNNAV
jgi:hypothetical protein